MSAQLYGPDGRPMHFAKDKKPLAGEIISAWNGERYDMHGKLPSQLNLGFDTSRLTIPDYRLMREHHQVSSSLQLVSMMMHQRPWRLIGDRQKEVKHCTENMRMIWTRLVRANSKALWAGYSPCATQWENDLGGGKLWLTKIKDLRPETAKVRWKDIAGVSERKDGMSTVLPRKAPVFDGIIQHGWPDIPVQNSYWYSLLMEDGDYYGTKLLNAAFRPWYFSMILHLYANRYMERFAEPTPVARAPFEEEIEINGKKYAGNRLMASLLQMQRNGSALILPNNRTVDSIKNDAVYDYTIEYIESQLRGVEFDRVIQMYDEEISLALFTPLLLMRNMDVGSSNLGVVHTECVSPETPILCADLQWRPAGKLQAGDEIVAFDEHGDYGNGRGNPARRYRTAVIEHNVPAIKHCMKVSTDIGDDVTATFDHPWLCWRRGTKATGAPHRNWMLQWVETKDLQVGDRIAHFGRPWQPGETFDDGWFSGFFDGEGTLSITRDRNGAVCARITLTQAAGPALDKAKRVLDQHRFSYRISEEKGERLGTKQLFRLHLNGGMREYMRFLGIFAPVRVMEKAKQLWEGVGLKQNQTYELATITAIEDIGDAPIASIQTSAATIITGGYLTHNTWLTILNALSGDWEEYINRYIIRPMAIHNFGPRAKIPRIEFRPLGRTDAETIRAIVQSLLSAGKIKFDFEELGSVLGLNVEEQEELTTDDPEDAADEVIKRTPSGDDRVGRPGKNVTPTGTDKVKKVARKIAARIQDQATKAFAEKDWADYSPDLGFRRQFVDALGEKGLSEWEAGEVYAEVQSTLERISGEPGSVFGNDGAEFAEVCEGALLSLVERATNAPAHA